MIDDSLLPEENDIRRRFLSDEGAAFTLLFRFENRRARERSERARAEPLALTVNKSPAAFIFIREIDDLQRENRSTISNEQVEEVSGDYANVLKSLLSLFNFRAGGGDGWVGWHWVLH